MSHSKMTKRGKSHYIQNWNASAKKYVNVCKVCGFCGYNPVIESDDFGTTPPNGVIRKELMQVLPPLPLDEFGRCSQCASALDKHKKGD